ncbi:unnamed protein product, partial [Ectocarpus sp. 12 AP-2014]
GLKLRNDAPGTRRCRIHVEVSGYLERQIHRARHTTDVRLLHEQYNCLHNLLLGKGVDAWKYRVHVGCSETGAKVGPRASNRLTTTVRGGDKNGKEVLFEREKRGGEQERRFGCSSRMCPIVNFCLCLILVPVLM